MPCYDGRDNEVTRTVYESGVSPSDLNREKNRSSWLESALCAVFNELEVRGIDVEVAQTASRHGLIDLMGFYSEHKKTDYNRLSKEIHKYSVDEQRMIRKILGSEHL